MKVVDIYNLPQKVKNFYKTANELEARIKAYSFNLSLNFNDLKKINSYFNLTGNERILDIGGGTGFPLLPVGPTFRDYKNFKEYINLDISKALLRKFKENVRGIKERRKIKAIEGSIVNLPFEDESFDIVLARHMLYHIADPDKGLKEVKRVLKKKGKFLATTNSKISKKELFAFHKECLSYFPQAKAIKRGAENFCSENGDEILKRYFKKVISLPWRGKFVFKNAREFLDYYCNTIYFKESFKKKKDLEKLKNLAFEKVKEIIKKKKQFTISHFGTAFICFKQK